MSPLELRCAHCGSLSATLYHWTHVIKNRGAFIDGFDHGIYCYHCIRIVESFYYSLGILRSIFIMIPISDTKSALFDEWQKWKSP